MPFCPRRRLVCHSDNFEDDVLVVSAGFGTSSLDSIRKLEKLFQICFSLTVRFSRRASYKCFCYASYAEPSLAARAIWGFRIGSYLSLMGNKSAVKSSTNVD